MTMGTVTHDPEVAPLFTAGFVIGALAGFVAALLAPRRSVEKKPPTEARMRPPVENVGDGEDFRRRQGNGERRWASLAGSAED